MSKKKILMQRFNGTGYDPQYPETHVKNVTGINQTVANNVGVATTDGATVIGEMSEIDYFISPQGTTTGTSTAYNLNIGSQYTSLDDMDGVVIRAKFHTTTGDNPTLNVNGLGAKPILAENGANIPYQIGENVWATLIWSSTLNGWIVQGWGKKLTFHKEIITKTTTWTAPEDIEGGMIDVMLFGGGQRGEGGAYTYVHQGGGGGHMAHKVIPVISNKKYTITIGEGGKNFNGSGGGVTSFDTLLSANGGAGGHGGTGGGGGSYTVTGGNGSYGGGGGGGGRGTDVSGKPPHGGNGGTYGGGGGAGSGSDASWAAAGTGGQYGGSGGVRSENGANGTDTTNIVGLEFRGDGKGGTGYEGPSGKWSGGGGGGGYGGRGGDAFDPSSSDDYGAGGGGGGYGANGGNGGIYGGGGGGGYGGRGGNGSYGGGGGGGYGLNGNGGVGGYSSFAGGVGGIAAGGGGGGTSANGGNGGDGICILTYWTRE